MTRYRTIRWRIDKLFAVAVVRTAYVRLGADSGYPRRE